MPGTIALTRRPFAPRVRASPVKIIVQSRDAALKSRRYQTRSVAKERAQMKIVTNASTSMDDDDEFLNVPTVPPTPTGDAADSNGDDAKIREYIRIGGNVAEPSRCTKTYVCNTTATIATAYAIARTARMR